MAEDKAVGVGFNIEEYWQIKALSVEWLYVLTKLKDSVKVGPFEQHCVVGVHYDGNPLYLLKRKYYPVAEISRVTGLAEDKLAAYTGILTLKSKLVEGLPEPTVTYWGLA